MKPCNQKSHKANHPDYICNPQTGNWVLRKGAIGKKLVQALSGVAPILQPKEAIKPKKIVISVKEMAPKESITLVKSQSIYYMTNAQKSAKLAVFDLDGTLIETLSGKT